MDTLTHALSGALLARATAPKEGPDVLPLRRRILLGFLAAAAPDLDVVSHLMSPLSHLVHHRGVTHSLLMLPIWALLLGWLCAKLWRDERGWRAYAGIVALGIGAHIAGDVITSYGTMIFAPFSNLRYEISTTFIIDLWFSGIIVLGLVGALIWRASRMPALAGAAVLLAYVGFQFALKHQAIDFGAQYARTAGMSNAKVSVLPRPVSPFNWMVVVESGDVYHYALVSLSRSEPPSLSADAGFLAKLGAPYMPLPKAQWVKAERYGSAPEQVALAKEALARPEFDFFRWFATYPMLYRMDVEITSTCVWFQDLRFFTPGRLHWPFRYGMCRESAGPWRAFELTGERSKQPLH